VTPSDIRTEDLLSDIPCSYGCSTIVSAEVKHTFFMLERNIYVGKSIIFPDYVSLFHSISGVECMKRSMGKHLQMRMLNASDRFRADN